MTPDFYCPISHQIMTDPVITEDGHTYQRDQILTWFENHNTSPLTGLTLSTLNVFPNIILRNQISHEFPNLTMSSFTNHNNSTNNNNSTNQTLPEPRTARTYIENQLELQENNNTNINLINNSNIWNRLGINIDSREDLNRNLPLRPFRMVNYDTVIVYRQDIETLVNLIIDLDSFSREVIDFSYIGMNNVPDSLQRQLNNEIIENRLNNENNH